MQLSFVPLSFRATGFSFKQGLSGTLTGLTTVGAISVVAFNIANTQNSLTKAFEPLKQLLEKSSLLDGINKLSASLHSWGSAIVGTKDAFKEWVNAYLNPHGLKAGAVNLYSKLVAWADIVYTWFKEKFWIFITNIPEMVRKWDQLRLSLFKWGTFLGGGGGAALWAALGGGADLSKLGDLMNHPNFAEIMENFNTLLEENQEALEELGEDGLKAIIEEYLENPDKANEAAEALNKESKERKERAEQKAKEKEENKEPEKLTSTEILEQFKPSKGGNPPNSAAMLGSMIKGGLEALLKTPSFSFESHATRAKKARQAMEKYLDDLKSDVESKLNKSKVKKKFWDTVQGKKEDFLKGLTDAAEKAYSRFEPKYEKGKEAENLEKLTKEFINALTVPSKGDKEGDAAPLVEALSNKNK